MLYGAQKSSITPIPIEADYDIVKAELGKILFVDKDLSLDRSTSCESCHSFEHGGADPRDVSIGVSSTSGNIQSPTVFNARYNFKQFWNGRADTLKQQASAPIHNPVEMNMSDKMVEHRLNNSQMYRALFEKVYADKEIKFEQVLDAIVEFEKALTTPNGLFDRYLRGEIDLSADQARGYRRFKELGCVICHNGVNVGGNSFQKMGLFVPYRYDESYPDLYSITKKEHHKNVFKIPTLRNIELTAPYFHDASVDTLEDAVMLMGMHDLGIIIEEQDVEDIVIFLKTLTGETPEILR